MKKVDEKDLSLTEAENAETKELTELSADEEVAAVTDNKELTVPEEKPSEIKEAEPEEKKELAEKTEKEPEDPKIKSKKRKTALSVSSHQISKPQSVVQGQGVGAGGLVDWATADCLFQGDSWVQRCLHFSYGKKRIKCHFC